MVRSPAICPVCRAEGSLEAHGYYERDTTDDDGVVLQFQVRRFRCRHCRKTVSCLPRFAQPYRVVNSNTIGAYFSGQRTGRGIERNMARLERYWQRFAEWAVQLSNAIGLSRGPAPPTEPLALWHVLRTIGCGLGQCTLGFVRDFGVTFFGAYLCHRRPALA